MFKNILEDLFRGITNLVYPPYCTICGKKIITKEFNPLCPECIGKIKWNLPPFCSICGRNTVIELFPINICLECKKQHHFFDRAWSVSLYEGIMRECIHKFKYERRFELIYFFERILEEFIKKFINIGIFDYIFPIPLHPKKLREREFNQALLIAEPIAKKFKKKILLRNIYRKKYTLPQSELKAEDRRKNIKGAFVIKNTRQIVNKNIFIIDDILTTGATVDECAKLFKESGANIIEVLTIAS